MVCTEIAFAKNNPQAEIVALDWAPVLEVAKENARNAAVSDRYGTIEVSAFDVGYGSGYDLVLLTNSAPLRHGHLRSAAAKGLGGPR